MGLACQKDAKRPRSISMPRPAKYVDQAWTSRSDQWRRVRPRLVMTAICQKQSLAGYLNVLKMQSFGPRPSKLLGKPLLLAVAQRPIPSDPVPSTEIVQSMKVRTCSGTWALAGYSSVSDIAPESTRIS